MHGAMQVMEDFAGLGGDGKLLPDAFSEKLAFGTQQFVGAAIEKGEIPVAVDAGDGVGGGFEDLAELAGGGVEKEFGALPGWDGAGNDDDAVFVGASGYSVADVERVGV